MNKPAIGLIGFLLMIVLGSACKSKKSVTTQFPEAPQKTYNGKAVLLKGINLVENNFSYYSATGKMDYKDDKMDQELGVNIVMEKDQYVFLNVTALMGITVARVLATPDSLVILDLLHRRAIIANYDYVKKMTGADLRLTNLQNLIIGNTLFPNQEEKSKVDSLANAVQIIQQLTQSISQKTVYNNILKVQQSSISEPAKKQELSITYHDVYTQGSNMFPAKFNINIRAEKNMESQLELKTFVFEKKKEIQFSIPKSYERVRL
jgi:hypothetical protein